MRSTLKLQTFARGRGRAAALAAFAAAFAALLMLSAQLADANPDHSAGDYFIFAKAAGDGTSATNREMLEPNCNNGSNDKQAEVSGSSSFFYGRIHSNADWANSGASNTFVPTPSPDPELTYGVNDTVPVAPSPPDCEVQANAGNYNSGGLPLNITASGDPDSVHGPHQIGEHGWPGNLGEFLNDSDGVTFGNDVTQVLPGASCQQGTSLTDTDTYTITSADAGMVICNGTGLIKFGQQGLGTLATPFRITMISHGPIEIQDSNLTLAPMSHGVLAWTDMRWSDNATAIKLAGQGINVVERSILFTPRGGQDVSGSDQATLCLQMIGQGRLKAAGSTSHFGPLAPGCGVPATVVTEIHANRGGNAHDNLGAGQSAVRVGTTIHDKVVVTSKTLVPTNLTGPITVNRYNTGNCSGTPAETATFTAGAGYTPSPTVTLDDVLPFTPAIGVYSYRASYGGDSNLNMAAPGSCEGPVSVVDARISIAQSGTNRAGDPHTFTVTVERNDGTGWTAASGITVTPSAVGIGSITSETCSTTGTDASGECTVTVDSATPGTTTVNATATVSVGGLNLPVNSAGVGAHQISNVKTWVDARISIAQSGTNRAGDPHTFTVTVEKHDGSAAGWVAAAGVVVTATETGVGTITAQTCTAGTGNAGTCTVTVNSATPGVTTVNATATVAVGVLNLPVNSAGVGAHEISNVKTHVDARISIEQDGTNKVGDPHTFTVTVEKNDGSAAGWVPASNVAVTPTETGVGDITGQTCTAGTTAAGTCTVTVNSTQAGISTVHATGTVSVGGLSLLVNTNGVGAHEISNTKTWADARITIGQSGTNKVGAPHTFTVTVEKNPGSGWVPAAGVTVTGSESGIGSITAQTCTAGTGNDGKCTITVNSTAPGTSTVDASATVTIGAVSVAVSTAGYGAHNVSNTKTWVDARISIVQSGTNPLGEPHTFTVTVEKNPGSGWLAAAGVTVTASESGVGAITAQTCDNPGTDGDGECTVTVNSLTAGTSTVTATATVGVGGLQIDVSTAGYGAHTVSNTKTWVDQGNTLLIIDEDSLDNGIHFNQTGGGIIPDGPSFFGKLDVNDDKPSHTQRDVLRYFGENVGKTITVKTGQTNDEGWFAPNCIPAKWLSGTSNTCLGAGASRDTAIDRYFGLSGPASIPLQSKLDKIPAVMPLRARGLVSLIGKTVCAVVYDSDISVNYVSSSFPFTNGNLQGETLGIVAFSVDAVRKLNGFSASTLPEVQLTIRSTSTCGTWKLLNAPVPRSSSVPNDIDPANLAGTGTNGYRALITKTGEPLLY